MDPPPSSPPAVVRFGRQVDSTSQDSMNTGDGTTTSSSQRPVSMGSPALRANLTRSQRNRDPLFYYQVETVLGIGSMGSVAQVRKRPAVVGGSARHELRRHYQKERTWQACFSLPVVGGLFQHCFKGQLEFHESTSTSNNNNAFVQSSNRSSSSGVSSHRMVDTNHHDEDTGTNNHEQMYAMKSIHLGRVTDEQFLLELKNEIQILKTLDHPHIVKAMETFEHRHQIFIIMELCQGGDLYSRDPYTEEEAARITASVLSAIAYMHSKQICHRDLKYENILFCNTSPQSEVKLIDFGLSAAFGNDELTDGVGTIYTMAPEVLKGKYGMQADLWSVGVICYMLLSSQMPFYGKRRKHIVEQIMAGKYEFKGRRWKRVSNPAKEFVKDLLVLDPEDRLTASEALSASWLNKRYGATVRNPYQDELESAHQSMVQYSKYSKLKQVALMIVAHKSTSDEIGILRKIFQKYDTNGVGQLSRGTFHKALEDAGYPPEQAQEIFDALDLDGTGQIRYTEFLASTIEAQGAIDERRLAEAFDRLDTDDSGFITEQNLRDMLGDEFPESEIDAIIKESDLTHDGKVSYMEFLAQWQDHKETRRQEMVLDISNLRMRDSSHHVDTDSLTTDGSDHGEDSVLASISFTKGKTNSERKSMTSKVPPVSEVPHIEVADI